MGTAGRQAGGQGAIADAFAWQAHPSEAGMQPWLPEMDAFRSASVAECQQSNPVDLVESGDVVLFLFA